MLKQRILLGLGAFALCGVGYAALSPVLPFQQGMSPAQEEHKMVLEGVGHWEGTIKMVMPGGQEVESPCSEVVTALGDLWTFARFEMEMMGMKFEGVATMGYDVKKKKYVGTWVDNTNAFITPMEGTYDEAKKAILMTYESPDPMTGKMKNMRQEIRKDGDSTEVKFFRVEDGDDQLEMTIAMKRKAVPAEAGADK